MVSKIENSISFKAVHGESGTVNIKEVNEWKKYLKEITQNKKKKYF